MPGATAERTSFAPAAISRSFAGAFRVARRPLRLPRWAVIAAVAVLALASYYAGRRHPAHHYVAYFGYPMVLDTTTGKACYAVPPPQPAGGAPDAAFPLDGTANSTDTQPTSGAQIPLCGR
jgi:hypothetical protein